MVGLVEIGRLKLFLEYEPDLVLSPNTNLNVVMKEKVERVLVDPGVPLRVTHQAGRFRALRQLISELDGFPNLRRTYIVAVDDWDPKINVKLYKRTLEMLREVKIRTDYEVVLYVHGYFTDPGIYRGLLNDVIVGIPTAINTLHYPHTARCNSNIGLCEKDVAMALTEFSKIHLGGPGLKMLRAVSKLLSSGRLIGEEPKIEWLSADTEKTRLRYGDLPIPKLPKDPEKEAIWHRQYVAVFLEKLMRMRF